MHVALHFLLPGMHGLGSLVSTPLDQGVVWRTIFVIGPTLGLVEAIGFLRAPDGPTGRVEHPLPAILERTPTTAPPS